MYYIFDCNGDIVGNPKGYHTFKGANKQANGKTLLNNFLWARLQQRKLVYPNATLINRIEFVKG